MAWDIVGSPIMRQWLVMVNDGNGSWGGMKILGFREVGATFHARMALERDSVESIIQVNETPSFCLCLVGTKCINHGNREKRFFIKGLRDHES